MAEAGRLTERIAFDAVIQTQGEGGGTVSGFEERFVVSARRRYLRGGEGVQAARLEGRRPLVLTIRRSSQSEMITAEWRARDTRSSEVYDIKSVEPSEDRRDLDVLCEVEA
ncbi:head-tail adaptor protein [Jiella marina]|uniref:head-tail adaptor protein n=1 Tax=Jiella sp. LLJ827 TaxID=2917712 RepID=UPI002100C9EA|nr:head-tail adaptor protein [Jiella sp. LLJ827]MCQ0987543.1 head-tail adaptor protein [Jiella sp. LLJ827]